MHAQTTAGSLQRTLTDRDPATPTRKRVRTSTRPRSPHASTEWIALAVVTVAVIATVTAYASENLPDEVRTRPVRVEQGDSLWALAGANPVEGLSTAETAELIRQANGMKDSGVRVGQLISVPDAPRLQDSVARK